MRISKFGVILCLVILMAAVALPSFGFTLTSPTEDQVVRERVRIVIPISALPADALTSDDKPAAEKFRPFVSLHVGDSSKQFFVAALSPELGTVRSGKITFVWDSKAPYRDPASPKVDKFFKDGPYLLRVNIHDAKGATVDSATVKVQLRNKVARSNPAPAVRLVNGLTFGKTRLFGVHADVQVYEMVNRIGLPILGGLGMTSDFKVYQTVDDVRDDGTLLLRYRVDKDARVVSFGQKRDLYQAEEFAPQLYRLVTKLGKVVKRNVFSRQAEYTITDVLPMLPSSPVREGDSWPSAMTLKVEGITNPITFTGTSMLDSFEWQDGHECAKIVSRMTGAGTIMLAGGKIRSESSKVEAQMTTYFAYRSGTMLRNQITLDFPALILPGAGEPGEEFDQSQANPAITGIPPDIGDEDEVFNRGPRPNISRPGGTKPAAEGPPEGTKKGSVQINVVVRLEK